jgi:hypothetical protein
VEASTAAVRPVTVLVNAATGAVFVGVAPGTVSARSSTRTVCVVVALPAL